MEPSPRSAFVPSSARASALKPSAAANALSTRSACTVSVARNVSVSASPTLQTQLAPALAPRTAFPGRPYGGPVGTIVVLFRADLRVDDHAPLTHAMEEAATVVPVFCFDPRHFGKTSYGFEKTGRYRACFLLESVKALRETLKGIGSDIVVRIGQPEDVVPDICRRVGAKRVFMHAETTYEEQQVEDGLEKALMKNGAELKRFWGNTLYHIDDLPFGMDCVPDVYSDFREAVEIRSTVRPPLKAPEALAPLPGALEVGEVPTLAQLNIDDSPASHLASGSRNVADHAQSSSGVRQITGGEREALRRVRTYVDETRRAELGSALGCVSPRRIFEELRKVAPQPDMITRSATYFELVWRDFFRFITCKYSTNRIGKSAAGSERGASSWVPASAAAGAL